MEEKFCHLHVHSEYSTLDGINRVDTLPDHINSMGQKACAITDHGNVAGTYTFYKSCISKGIKPLLGMEAYYSIIPRTEKIKDEDGNNYYHLVLLAQNNTGLKNLYKLSTKAFTEGFYHKPRCDDSLIAECSEGLIATSACLGSRSSQLILSGRGVEAERLLLSQSEAFKDRFFIEVQLHTDKEQQLVNHELIKIADKYNLPLVLTNDCHYTHEEDKHLHEQTLCVSTNAKMSYPPWNSEVKREPGTKTRFSFGEIDVHVATAKWMLERAKAQGIPESALTNTMHVANMINHEDYFIDKKNRYPVFKSLEDELVPWQALENMAKNRLTEKLGGTPPQEYKDRLNHELQIIKKMGFYDYLLIVQEFCADARAHNVWIGPGRGSAAGSLTAYALGITNVDPIKYGLVFERWLNIGRAAEPLFFDAATLNTLKGLSNEIPTVLPKCGGTHLPMEHVG